MTLAETCIRRPVLAIVMSIALVLIGGIAFFYLGVREYPAVDPPVVTVTTTYAGASPEVIDSQITEPIEQSLAGIAGIKNISSTSREQTSSIRVEFDLSVDLDDAANDVRDKVAQAIRRLPTDADPPVVEKADADSVPIVFLTVYSDTKDILEVSNIANTFIKDRVQTIPGVSTVRIFGEKRYSMRLWLDADKMAAHNVTPDEVRRALESQNVDLPAGSVEGDSIELSVKTEGRLTKPEEFRNLTIRDDGHPIKLRDIGDAELGPLNTRAGLRIVGRDAIGVAVIPQPNTNAIAIADEFYERMKAIEKEIPSDYQVEIGYDFTKSVRKSVLEVEETLILAFILVALVIFAFLRDWRATIIPVIAIPVSIIATFGLVWAFGFSINVLTLVGIVLSIGLVCDDAIVVLEIIYTKIEHGMRPLAAAIEGSREIYFAIISTTITLAVVFSPIMFTGGLTGRLFREFAVVVVGSVLISGFVAVTLSPMMSRYLLRQDASEAWLYRVTEPFFGGMTRLYERTLRAFMRVRVLAPVIIVLIIAWTVKLYVGLPQELAPLEDRSNVRINTRGPEGTTYAYTEHQLDQLATWVNDEIPETYRTYSIIGGFGGQGTNTGTQNVYLVDPEQRGRSQEQIFQQISKGMGQFTGVSAFPAQPPTIGSRQAGQPVQYVLKAQTLDRLSEVLPKFLEQARQRPEIRFVDSDLKLNRPQLSMTVDRAKADELGVSVLDVARALQLGLGGVRYGYFIREGKQYEVIGQLMRDDRDDPSDIGRLGIRTKNGEIVPLDTLTQHDDTAGPGSLFRFDRYVSATVSAGLSPGYTLGDGIRAMDQIAAETLPEGVTTGLAGEARDYAESASSASVAFVLAVVLIFLVLAALFESFRDPVVILMTVPLAAAGALAALHYTHQSLNVFSRIGIIMLVGLVTKNGILVVEFANHKRQEGLTLVEACIQGAAARFRPILMTSLATVLGVLPIALSLGGAAGSRRSLGIAVAGGLTFALVLTLYLVPAIHSLFARKHAKVEEDEVAPPVGHADPAPVAGE
ncbi:MAG: efflux RND transporter permease subunit [Polyangiaceae bacterium]|nr:efflux RND transporter permease subunit [Polyangiaceae bacterium]